MLPKVINRNKRLNQHDRFLRNRRTRSFLVAPRFNIDTFIIRHICLFNLYANLFYTFVGTWKNFARLVFDDSVCTLIVFTRMCQKMEGGVHFFDTLCSLNGFCVSWILNWKIVFELKKYIKITQITITCLPIFRRNVCLHVIFVYLILFFYYKLPLFCEIYLALWKDK